MPAPYQGNPANDPTIIEVPDDGDDWDSSIINPPTESLADSVSYLRSKSWVASENWPAGMELWNSSMLPSNVTLSGVPPVWDSAYGRWLAFVVDATGGAATAAYMIESEDGRWWRATTGNIGTSPGSPSSGTGFASIQGMWVRPTDGAILRMINYAASGGSVTQLQSNSGSTLTPNIGAEATPSSGNWWSGGYLTAAGLFVVWLGGATSGGGWIPLWSNGTAAFALATTWSPPAGFVVHNLAHLAINYTSSCVAIIFPAGTSVVASLMATIDGQNWFTEPMPTFTLGSEAVIDAAFDSFTNTIYLLSGNSTNANLWASTVLGTWTLVKAFSVPCYAVRANGREVLVWAKFGNSYNGSTLAPCYRALVSINPAATPGASTWYSVGLTSTSHAPGTYFCLRANGAQFMYVNTNEFAASAAAPLVSPAGV